MFLVYSQLGKLLVIAGILLVIIGVFFLIGGNIPYFGNLPGDIHLKFKNTEFYFPITSGLIVSIVLSGLINLIIWLIRGR